MRDADHRILATDIIRYSPMVSAPVIIGNDCWIGKGAAVLRGFALGDGVVVGANSVVKSVLPSHTVAVGAPARVVKRR